jgi:hypothetical protein
VARFANIILFFRIYYTPKCRPPEILLKGAGDSPRALWRARGVRFGRAKRLCMETWVFGTVYTTSRYHPTSRDKPSVH